MKIKWLKGAVWIVNLVILMVLVIFFLSVFSQRPKEDEIPENKIFDSGLESDTNAGFDKPLSLREYSIIWKMFEPEAPPPKPHSPPLKLEFLELRLKGTIIEKDRSLAVVSDHKRKEHLLKVGDEIEGASVLEITQERVILGYHGHRIALYVKPNEEGKRAEVLPAETH